MISIMLKNIEDVKKMILQEFNVRTNDSVNGKIDFSQHPDVLDGIARTYMYYAQNFPDKIDPSKIDGGDRFGRVLSKSVPNNMADLYLGRLLLNMLEIGGDVFGSGVKGQASQGAILFDRNLMSQQVKSWHKDVSFSQQDMELLRNNEAIVIKNLNDKVVIHELSHMSAKYSISPYIGFASGTRFKPKQTYASRLEEIGAELTALNVTCQKIPSTQRIVSGNREMRIGGYNPESSNFAISSFIELAPFAFGRNEFEMGRLMSPESYIEELNSKYSAFARNGGTFAGRIQEDFKAITDNLEYNRLFSLQADFISIGMSRITEQNYLNTCSEDQFKQDVGFLLKVNRLLLRFGENNQPLRTDNIVTYDKAMNSIENIFNNLKTNRNLFEKYNTFEELKTAIMMDITSERRMSLGLSSVINQHQTTPQSQSGNPNQLQTPTSRPAVSLTAQSQQAGQSQQPQTPVAGVGGAYATLDAKIKFLESLTLVPKKKSDFEQELEGRSGIAREDLSCCYVVVNNTKKNVVDLTYTEIEKTLFEIVNIPDFDEMKRLGGEYFAVLNRARYVPSYGTLGRSLLEMDKLESSNLSNVGARREWLRDMLGSGNSMLQESREICNYIKGGNNSQSPLTIEEQSKVLLKMQDNYNNFGFSQNAKSPKNFQKLIDVSKVAPSNDIILVRKSDQEIQREESSYKGYRNYSFKSCPYTITSKSGEVRNIWDIGATDIINRLTVAIVNGNSNEIRKMRIVCENMQGHFEPSYNDMAKLTMLMNDYWKLSNNPDIDVAIESLKEIAVDKYNKAFAIAKFNAQRAGRERATYPEMVEVFRELQIQNDLKKQAQLQDGGMQQ